jgi:hypothetical protein
MPPLANRIQHQQADVPTLDGDAIVNAAHRPRRRVLSTNVSSPSPRCTVPPERPSAGPFQSQQSQL